MIFQVNVWLAVCAKAIIWKIQNPTDLPVDSRPMWPFQLFCYALLPDGEDSLVFKATLVAPLNTSWCAHRITYNSYLVLA